MPAYVLNFDELAELIKGYLQNGITVNAGDITLNTDDLKALLEQIKDKLSDIDYSTLVNALNSLGAKIDTLNSSIGKEGTQKIYGNIFEIPSAPGDQVYNFKVPQNGKLANIAYSLSAWNYQDTWSLQINGQTLFNNVTTKEYGENKEFENFYSLNASDTISVIYHNNSAAAKILWMDFSILEV